MINKLILTVSVSLAPLSSAVGAALVSVEGGFTSFSGNVGAGGSFETYINGNLVCPAAGCAEELGPVTLTFAPYAGSIDFQNSSFDFQNGTYGLFPNTPNFVGFVPAEPQDVSVGQEFLLGTFAYANGIWFTDPTFGFTLTSVSADPTLNGHVFSDSLRLTITPNSSTNTPQQNADFVSFVGRPDLGSVRAYELNDSPTGDNVVSAYLYGRIGSLIPTRFAPGPDDGGFLDPGVELQPTVVPVPAAVWLFGSGLLGLVGVARRKTCTGMTMN